MDYRSLVGSFSVAFLAQGVSLGLSVLTSLFVPKVLGVQEYGYWQLFIFYSTYTALCHFGINDGLYLVNGGKRRDELDKGSILAQFRLASTCQVVVAILVVVAASVMGIGEKRLCVWIAVAVFTPLYNAMGLLGYLFQAIGETKLYSFSVVVDKLVFLAPLLLLLFFGIQSFEPYVASYCVSKACALAFCLWHARDILRAKAPSVREAIRLSIASIRVGSKLLIANLASMLILGIMRFFIDATWGIEVFGKVSFSLSLVSLFLVFINQTSMVLFPELRRVDGSEQAAVFSRLSKTVSVLLPGAYVAYFPIVLVIGAWLPQYEESLAVFATLLPVCVFDGHMNLIGITYLKVLRQEKKLLAINCTAVAFAAAGALIGVYALHSVEFMLIWSVAVVAGRSLFTEWSLMRSFGLRNHASLIQEVLTAVVFLTLSAYLPGWMAFLGCLLMYCILLWFNRAFVKGLMDKLRGIAGKKA